MPGIDQLTVSAFTVPTDLPESDGTYEWDHTTMVMVEVASGTVRGLGYTYGDLAAAAFSLLRRLRLDKVHFCHTAYPSARSSPASTRSIR